MRPALDHYARCLALVGDLPNVGASRWWNTPALAARKKSFARMKDEATLVLLLPLETKEMLMQAKPEVFHETDHYRGYPALLVRLDTIDDDELALWLRRSWATVACKTDLAAAGAAR
jgi:hypothetical protein